ncbi:MAG: efflux RND transporter periplasmic adaptor subunit [Halopseudomonas sp.]
MNKSVVMAVAVTIAMGAWMASGMQDETTLVSVVKPAVKAKPLMKVKVKNSSASKVQKFVRVQGQVEANRTIEIKVEIDGRVAAIAADEGQRLQAGDNLIQISPDYRPAQLAEAKAILKQRENDLAASTKLEKRGLQSGSRVIAYQADLQTAKAQLARIQHELHETRIAAPFDGILNKRMVELGDYMQSGDVVAELVDDGTVKVTGQVPQHSVDRLEENQSVIVVLNSGQEMTGKLGFISPVADPVTRSYRVEVQIPNPRHLRIIGLSATLLLPAGEQQGHLLPGSVLGLDEAGNLQVKLVDEDNRVNDATVDIIRTDKTGFWLSGLGDKVRIITIGQDFVVTGEEIVPVADVDLAVKQVSKVSGQEG